MEVLLFPDNKLNVTLEKFYNGHISAISTDTDQIQTTKYALAELELFRNNICGTVFNTHLTNNMNVALDVNSVGRIKFGLYNYTDMWQNPVTNVNQIIPDYTASKWTASGVSIFSGAVLGATKPVRYPNHGQQMFDISDGQYGYDVINNVSGLSNMSELRKWQEYQIAINSSLGRLSSFSYRNGRNDSPSVYIPYFLGARNSDADKISPNNYSIKEPSLVRIEDINKPSTMRTWDAWYHNGTFPTLEAGITYSQTRLQESIDNGGWFTEFIHWHSVYDLRTAPKGVAVNGSDIETFRKVFSGYNIQIGDQDVWRAGYGEVLEYFYLKGMVDMVGSFQESNDLYVFYRVKNTYPTDEIDITQLSTPISIRINTTGTFLQGKDIICDQAKLIRKINANEWIVSVPFKSQVDGDVVKFKIKEGTGIYYSSDIPTITRDGNVFQVDKPCKWTIYRKTIDQGLESVITVLRDSSFKTTLNYNIDIGYNYYVGVINEFGNSALIEVT